MMRNKKQAKASVFDDILSEIEKRKIYYAQLANVTDAQVMGATAQIAFADIADSFDDI